MYQGTFLISIDCKPLLPRPQAEVLNFQLKVWTLYLGGHITLDI